MGFLNFFKNIKNKSTKTNGTLSPVVQHISPVKNTLQIHPDIIDLLWIGDGPYQNYELPKSNEHIYSFKGFSIKISFLEIEEPSLLYFSLPTTQPVHPESVDRPPYYPSYKELTGEQKWLYWKFLSNPFVPENDIGYVFIFYYGLERHLLCGNFEKAYEIILRLRDVYDNKSFQMYSSNALILSAMLHKRGDYAEQFIESLDKDYEFQISPSLYMLCKLSLNMPIFPLDIMRFHKAFGFTNNRYIKNNPDIFLDILEKNLREATGKSEIYAEQFFSKAIFSKLSVITVPIFANISIKDKELEIPDMTKASEFTGFVYALLSKTHEDTKYIVTGRKKATSANVKKPVIFNPHLLPYDISKPLNSRENLIQFYSDLQILNDYLEQARQLVNIKYFLHIKKDDITFEGSTKDSSTHWEIEPYTKTKRLAKYPLTIYYRTKYYTAFDVYENYFGSISYLKDGSIGKAELVNWIKNNFYYIKLGIIDNQLVIKSIESHDSSHNRIYLYKI